MFEPLQKQALDPVIVEMERRWHTSGIPGLYEGNNGPVSRERARNIRALLYPKPQLPHGAMERLHIAGPGGELELRIIRPVSGEPTGTLVYYHGGGWVVGDVDSHEAHAIRLANRAGVVVVNVEYRLAPEHTFPAAYDDAVAAMVWANAHLAQLGGATNLWRSEAIVRAATSRQPLLCMRVMRGLPWPSSCCCIPPPICKVATAQKSHT